MPLIVCPAFDVPNQSVVYDGWFGGHLVIVTCQELRLNSLLGRMSELAYLFVTQCSATIGRDPCMHTCMISGRSFIRFRIILIILMLDATFFSVRARGMRTGTTTKCLAWRSQRWEIYSALLIAGLAFLILARQWHIMSWVQLFVMHNMTSAWFPRARENRGMNPLIVDVCIFWDAYVLIYVWNQWHAITCAYALYRMHYSMQLFSGICPVYPAISIPGKPLSWATCSMIGIGKFALHVHCSVNQTNHRKHALARFISIITQPTNVSFAPCDDWTMRTCRSSIGWQTQWWPSGIALTLMHWEENSRL